QAADRARTRLDELSERPLYLKLVGVTTANTLRDRIAAASPEGPDAAVAARIIDRVETQLAESAALTHDHVVRLRRMLTIVLALAALSVVLVSSLGFILLSRWVVAPVRELRVAAERIGAGDFAHQAPIRSADELGRLSLEVNHMARLVAAMQEQRIQQERLAAIGEMLRRIAHNLRNPLAGIRSLAELTAEEVRPNEELVDNQRRIIGAVDRLQLWMEDLLSATSPLRIEPAEESVQGWLAAVVETRRAAAESRGVRLALDVSRAPVCASFDARHLEHAIAALIDNAIDASPSGATVQVDAESESSEWRIRVADQGPGVAPDARDRIFDPNFTTKPAGSGIGLAFARQVALGHGGCITLAQGLVRPPDQPSASGNGHGAAFLIQLPVAAG
ncbi:MAG: HAMP domain-containing sensor histidine kinase, partial [Planctomycetota bacterium]|nr:HAMP domain-containing sensor histidine kinase [Planctomycetota bacterium]